ncbi:MAG: hypothetical protein LLF94_11125 [Chlamydiales bacterium]|nr:hypothetical protein [Chlamydiales bacterium]
MLLHDTLHGLSDTHIQELLHIDLVQQILARNNSSAKSLTIALNALSGTSRNKVQLQPKSDDHLKGILESIEILASTIDTSKATHNIITAAKRITASSSVDELVDFAKLYYQSCLTLCLAGLIQKA